MAYYTPAEIVRIAFGITGNVIFVIIFFYPALTSIPRIYREGSVGQASPVSYLVTLANCIPIVHHPECYLFLLPVNSFGCLASFVYLCIYIHFSDHAGRKMAIFSLLLEGVCMACLSTFVLWFTDNYQERSVIVGFECIASNLAAYRHEFMTMYQAIQRKSVEGMPLFTSLAFFASSAAWTAFACIVVFDPFLFGVNVFGVFVAALELFIHAYFYKTTKMPNLADRLILWMVQRMTY